MCEFPVQVVGGKDLVDVVVVNESPCNTKWLGGPPSGNT